MSPTVKTEERRAREGDQAPDVSDRGWVSAFAAPAEEPVPVQG